MQKEDFIAYLTFEKRFSGNTIQAYRTDLKEFSEFLEKNYKFSDISSVDHTLIRSWLVELYRQHNSPRTINRKISCLKSFFRFCIREGLLTASPMNKVISPKAPKPLPEFLSRENLKTLLNDVNFGTGYEAVRNKLIILLFYCTGIRCSELRRPGCWQSNNQGYGKEEQGENNSGWQGNYRILS
jgi:integrase/recombinase XerC